MQIKTRNIIFALAFASSSCFASSVGEGVYKGNNSCLVIKEEPDGIQIVLFEYSSGGYSCYIEGKLNFVNGRLFWRDWFTDNGDGIFVYEKAGSIIVEPVYSISSPSGHCGIHASLSRLVFSSHDVTIPWQSNSRPVYLDNYCPH